MAGPSFVSRLFHRRRPSTHNQLHSPLPHPNPAVPAHASVSAPATSSASAAASAAFTVLGRRFRFRPAKPNLTLDLNHNHSQNVATTQPDPISNDTDNLLLLNSMAGQGPSALLVQDVVFDAVTSVADIDRDFYNSEGYLGVRIPRTHTNYEGRLVQDYVFDFATAMDASGALLSRPTLTIATRSYAVVPYNGEFGDPEFSLSEPVRARARPAPPPPTISPPRKRPKVEAAPDKVLCKICYTELDDDDVYSTPCRRCKSPRCYDCLKKHFETAMRDFDRMPVMCCFSVMHHDVARGILPEAELEEYKQKYDEFSTVDPLYCPIPTCSAFIPPRFFKQNDTTVICHVCSTLICIKCKQYAGAGHTCPKEDTRQVILDTFHYKLCPKCGMGVMKMFGCPHVRCQCGAHWCWDCQRPMNACYQKPCRAARDDGQQSLRGDEESESEIEETPVDENAREMVPLAGDPPQAAESNAWPENATAFPPPFPLFEGEVPETEVQGEMTAAISSIVTTNSQPVAETNGATIQAVDPQAVSNDAAAPEATVNANQNLDDPEGRDWERESLDFGEEPTDESWDTWGCRHQFHEFQKHAIPDFWLVGVRPLIDPEIKVECMTCFKKVKVWGSKEVERENKETQVEEGETPVKEREAAGNSSANGGTRTKKLITKAQYSFECRRCGVIYCGTCKKAATRRILRERMTPDVV